MIIPQMTGEELQAIKWSLGRTEEQLTFGTGCKHMGPTAKETKAMQLTSGVRFRMDKLNPGHTQWWKFLKLLK